MTVEQWETDSRGRAPACVTLEMPAKLVGVAAGTCALFGLKTLISLGVTFSGGARVRVARRRRFAC